MFLADRRKAVDLVKEKLGGDRGARAHEVLDAAAELRAGLRVIPLPG